MNTKKQNFRNKTETPNSKLQKSSVIFMQLGLILALLAVYFTLEHRSIVKLAFNTPIDDGIIYEPTIGKIEIIKPKVIVPKVIVKKIAKPIPVILPKQIENIKIVSNITKIVKTNISPTDIEPTDIVKTTISKPIQVVKKKEPIAVKNINFVQKVPTFPGCTGTNQEKKACFNLKINQHIQKYFNIDLAQDLGLSQGKKRIDVQFIIDQNGNVVDLITRAPHKRLKKEVEKIINKLPRMTPGQQNDTKVKVRYSLPIMFNVTD